MFFCFGARLQINIQVLKKRRKGGPPARFPRFYPKTTQNATSNMVKGGGFPV
jgi:hypothetical protein